MVERKTTEFLPVLFFLATAVVVELESARVRENLEPKCNGVILNDVYFDKQLLFDHLGKPCNLVMHKYSGQIFFSHTVWVGGALDFQIMACHLATNSCHPVPGIAGGYAIAYDAGNDDIYMGGHDGIYKFNFMTHQADYFAESGASIWDIFIKMNFYYIEYPTQKLHVYQEDDTFVAVAEASDIEIDHFFMSKDFEVYFSNKTALVKVPHKGHESIVLSNDVYIRQIVEDSFGDLYFCATNGIYVEDVPLNKIKKIANIENTYGMTFDENDHPIYSDRDSIYKLIVSEDRQICYDLLKTLSPTA